MYQGGHLNQNPHLNFELANALSLTVSYTCSLALPFRAWDLDCLSLESPCLPTPPTCSSRVTSPQPTSNTHICHTHKPSQHTIAACRPHSASGTRSAEPLGWPTPHLHPTSAPLCDPDGLLREGPLSAKRAAGRNPRVRGECNLQNGADGT